MSHYCLSALVLLISLGLPSSLCAQRVVSVTTETVSLHLKPIVSSALEPASEEGNTFVFDEEKLYETGIERQNATALSVKSNQNWVVTVRAEQPYFFGNEEGKPLPVSILSVRANDGQYIPLSNDDVVISQSNDKSIKERDKRIDISYLAKPGETLDTGSYSVKLVFTVTSR